MGIFSEYLNKNMSFPDLVKQRKKQLKRISDIRSRPILSITSSLNKGKINAPISIDYDDRLGIMDQLHNIEGSKIDIILETPGGSAEVVEDIVKYIRSRFSEVGIIIPGYAKSAGTIFAMSGDEILMEPGSALGPIDAQIIQNGKRYSAHAFLQGLDNIKDEVKDEKYLNKAYIPILQNISPGEIQHCENALKLSKEMVTNWLSNYKFKYWTTHSTNGKKVTNKEKRQRAEEIAEQLCNNNKWLTHGRSITIDDLIEMKLKITDYSSDDDLYDAIRRYYVLLMMSFDTTNIYKIYETPDLKSQIYRHHISPSAPGPQESQKKKDIKKADLKIKCNCGEEYTLQANFEKNIPIKEGAISYPKDNIFICPNCDMRHDLTALRHQLESQTKKKILDGDK